MSILGSLIVMPYQVGNQDALARHVPPINPVTSVLSRYCATSIMNCVIADAVPDTDLRTATVVTTRIESAKKEGSMRRMEEPLASRPNRTCQIPSKIIYQMTPGMSIHQADLTLQ